MQQMHFVCGEIGRVRAEDFVNLVPVGHVNFEVELRFLIAEFFPRFADLASLLFGDFLRGMAGDDGARLQRRSGAKNTVPEIVGRDDREANRLAAFFGHRQRLREKMLLDTAKKLIGFELVFAGAGAAQQTHMQHDDVAAARLQSIEHIAEVIEIEVIADRHEDVAGTRADRFGTQFTFELEVELVHLDMRHAAIAATPLGDGEYDVQQDGESAARHRRNRLGEKVHDRDEEEDQRDDAQADGNLNAADAQIERHLEFALAGIRVTKHENGEAVHREAPNHTKRIQVGEEGDVAAADDDCGDLQDDDDVDDAIAGAEFRMRLAEPFTEHAVFGDAIEHAVGADDRGIDRTGENQRADDDDEAVEDQAGDERPGEVHRKAADQVFEEALADIVRDDHHREERNQRSEDQAVNENHHARLFQVGQLGAFDFAIDLRERSLAAHGEHGMAERDENRDDAEHVRQVRVNQPAQRFFAEVNVTGIRKWRQRRMAQDRGVNTPADQDHHHHGDQLHDVEGFFAGLGNALGVFPPEVDRDDDRECGRDAADRVLRKRPAEMEIDRQFAHQAGEILARGDAADRAGQDVVEHQRRNAEFRERTAQRLFDRAINAPADKHTAAFDVHRANGVREEHDRQDEPGSGLADEAFGFATRVVSR